MNNHELLSFDPSYRRSSSPTIFRDFSPKDIDAVLAIESDSFEFPWSGKDFKFCLSLDRCGCLVAEREGDVVGYAVYERRDRTIRLLSCAVLDTERRSGVGSALLRELAANPASPRAEAFARAAHTALVPLDGTPCEYVKEAKIGRAVMDADVLVSLTHFKGHEMMGVGGAVKNIGMGCGSRAGKLEMHSDGKPVLVAERCVGCGMCRRVCAHGALTPGPDRKMRIDHAVCAGCGRCIGVCPRDALEAEYGAQSATVLDRKTAEYALAVLKDRPHFHVALVRDVSPNCDCHAENDAPMIPNVGMLASFDPVALDVACVDLCNAAPRLSGTWLDGLADRGGDVFDTAHDGTRWRDMVDHAVRIGLGRAEYDLVRIG